MAMAAATGADGWRERRGGSTCMFSPFSMYLDSTSIARRVAVDDETSSENRNRSAVLVAEWERARFQWRF
jgi:hypothetical protein